MKILFFNLTGLRFNVTTPEQEPLGGSESAQCYLARELAGRGHDISLMARLPMPTPDTLMNIKHFSVDLAQNKDFFAAQKFDVVIVSNTALATLFMKELNPESRIIFWNHVATDHEYVRVLSNHDVVKCIDGIIYLSNWQQQETIKAFRLKVPSSVIGYGLTPSFENLFSSPQEILAAKKNLATYTSTPFRGLEILLRVFDDATLDTELDLYSSMKIYQVDGAKDRHADLYEIAKNNPRIHYHAPVSQIALAHTMKTAAFYTYPCIYPETFCNVAQEALAAGQKVITTRLGALPETTLGFATLVDMQSSADHLTASYRQTFMQQIASFKKDPTSFAQQRFDQIRYVNQHCRWVARADDWEQILKS